MVKADTGVKAIVERYCNETTAWASIASEFYCSVLKLKEGPKEGSDIDLIVISPMLATLSNRTIGTALRCRWILEPIQAFGVTPDEAAARRRSPFVQDLLDKQAVVIL